MSSRFEAFRIGLVNRVNTHNELKSVTQELAQKITQNQGRRSRLARRRLTAKPIAMAEAYAYMAQ